MGAAGGLTAWPGLIFGVPGQPLAAGEASAGRWTCNRSTFRSMRCPSSTAPFLRWVGAAWWGCQTTTWLQSSMVGAGISGGSRVPQYEISIGPGRKAVSWTAPQPAVLARLPYLGFGAGAQVRRRIQGQCAEDTGIERMKNGGRCASRPVRLPASAAVTMDAMQEHMMVGLRLTQEGVSAAGFERLWLDAGAGFGRQIDLLMDAGLLEWSQQGTALCSSALTKCCWAAGVLGVCG